MADIRDRDRQQLVAICRRWLDGHPDAPLRDRVVRAGVIACGADPDAYVPREQIAQMVDAQLSDVEQAFLSLREREELMHPDGCDCRPCRAARGDGDAFAELAFDEERG